MFSELWCDSVAIWKRSSFSQWLIGLALMILAGLLLYASGDSKPSAAGSHMARADSCLQAAGSDLKLGELSHHEMTARPCGCTAAN
jgi:hypothetical protein